MTVRSLGVVEGVEHAHAFQRLLVDAVDARWLGQSDRLEDGRDDIDEVVELPPGPGAIQARGPGNDHRRAATAARGDLLAVGPRRRCGVAPGCRIAAMRLRGAEIVDVGGLQPWRSLRPPSTLWMMAGDRRRCARTHPDERPNNVQPERFSFTRQRATMTSNRDPLVSAPRSRGAVMSTTRATLAAIGAAILVSLVGR